MASISTRTHTRPASSSQPRKSMMTRKPPMAVSDPSDAIQRQKAPNCQRTSCSGTPSIGASNNNSNSKKENVKVSAVPSQQEPARGHPPHFLHRTTRSTRLSDRWPVLTRIIKGQKAQNKEKKKLTTGHNASDTSSDEDDDVITIGSRSRPIYRPRVVHPTSPKYPSPLCGFLPVERESVERHRYAEHGYSRACLYNRREFWKRRRQDWEEYQLDLWKSGYLSEEAYGGIEEEKQALNLPEHLAHGPRHRCSSPTLRDLPQEIKEERPPSNPAIFPRLGDISTLRDPFLLSVDTWFDNYPLWSLSKMIWIYDLNCRTRHLRASEPRAGANVNSKESDGSNTSGDTLVASVSEDINYVICIEIGASCPDFKKDFHSDAHCTSLRSVKKDPIIVHHQTITGELPGACGLSYKSASLGHSSAPADDANDLQTTNPWESCWYSRWEIIYHEISLTAELLPSTDVPVDLERKNKEILRKIYMSSQNLYHPFAAEDDESLEIGEQERESCGAALRSAPGKRVILPVEEEDDYGEIIENPRYRLGATINPLSMFATSSTRHKESTSTTEIHFDDKTGITVSTLSEEMEVGCRIR